MTKELGEKEIHGNDVASIITGRCVSLNGMTGWKEALIKMSEIPKEKFTSHAKHNPSCRELLVKTYPELGLKKKEIDHAVQEFILMQEKVGSSPSLLETLPQFISDMTGIEFPNKFIIPNLK